MTEAGSKGRFITFEGGEGAGKSTQITLLFEAMRRAGLPALATREPGGSPGAEAIRRLLVDGEPGKWDPMTELLLHYAARRDHLVRTIWPTLGEGKWVISDRFADSTRAYQGYAAGVEAAAIAAIHKQVVGDFAPHLTFILDLPAEEGLRRAGTRGGWSDRYERMGIEYHRRLRDGFLEIARGEPGRCVVIDAARSVEAVHRAILAGFAKRFDRVLT